MGVCGMRSTSEPLWLSPSSLLSTKPVLLRSTMSLLNILHSQELGRAKLPGGVISQPNYVQHYPGKGQGARLLTVGGMQHAGWRAG